MSDAELRELERAVERDGSATTRVKLAAELERLGRVDEAVDVLVVARESREAREALSRLRPPSSGVGNARSSYHDVRPLDRAPRLAWKRPGSYHQDGCIVPAASLRASPLGIVPDLIGELTILDPETGSVRQPPPFTEWRRGEYLAEGAIVYVVIAAKESFDAIDVWSGETLRSGALGGPKRSASQLFLVENGSVRRAEPKEIGAEVPWMGCVWADRLGCLSETARRDGLVLRDRAGTVLWRLKVDFSGCALGPETVVVGRNSLALYERSTGRELAKLGGGTLLTQARDVVFHTTTDHRDIRAVRLTGEELWRVSLADLGARFIRAASALDRWLYLMSENGSILALTSE